MNNGLEEGKINMNMIQIWGPYWKVKQRKNEIKN